MSRRWIIVIVAAVVLTVVGAVVAWRSRSAERDPGRTVEAQRQRIEQAVTFTGTVEAGQSATLSFELPGTVTQVPVAVGDIVEVGGLLAKLDSEIAALELAQARASRLTAQAEAALAVEQARQYVIDVQAENSRTLEARRQAVRDAKASLDQERLVHQQRARELGDDSATAASAQGLVLAAESAYHAAQTALRVAQETADKTSEQARAALESAQVSYETTQSAAPGVAGLSTVEASEALARARLNRSTLVAPFAGTVVAVPAQLHEYIGAGSPAIVLQGVTGFEIVADVPETDALTLAVGQQATVTFDALSPDEEWSATVTRIAPVATVIEGLPTYEVALELIGDQERLRAGLSANVTVHVAARDNVVAIPRRALIRQDGVEYVRVRGTDGFVAQRRVTTGLLGSDGLVEIVAGVSVGDQVVVDQSD